MKHFMKLAVSAFWATLTLRCSNAQVLSDELDPPYALRIISPDRLIDGTLVQKDDTDGVGLFIRESSKSLSSSTWTFSTTGPLNETQLKNATTQLIILGSRIHMWDLEASSMQMVAVDQAHAQTGYQGTPWPSAYNVANWKFDIQRSGNGRWMMGSGRGHGDWRAQPDQYRHKSEAWSLFWWNGKRHLQISNIQWRRI